jgi:hypothetical protein
MSDTRTHFGLAELITIGQRLQAQDFDHVFTLNPDGTVFDAPANLYAPEVYVDHSNRDRDVATWDGWECAVYGMSGQDSYRGGIMHPSEFIGAGIARRLISDEVQTFAVVAVEDEYDDDDRSEAIGWTIVRYIGKVA